MLRRQVLFGSGACLASGCATRARVSVAPARTSSPSPSVGRYESTPWSFSTASYWVEGDEGVVVFDTQFLASEAESVLDAAEAVTGKPVVAAVVLHPNPDKFNGTSTFQARGVEVLTSTQVRAAIPAVHAQRLRAFGDRYAPDFPRIPAAPDAFGDTTTTLRRAGLELTLHVLGAGCGAHHVVVQWNNHAFVGDLVANGAHSWMELGMLDRWQARLGELEAMGIDFVHPGRGPSGGRGLVAEQSAYLREAAARADAVANAGLGAAAAKTLEEQIIAAYPNHRFRAFVGIAAPELLARAG
ncbi:MAG: MBL fold metallo-hydrolase [Nannocystales bacterium]